MNVYFSVFNKLKDGDDNFIFKDKVEWIRLLFDKSAI